MRAMNQTNLAHEENLIDMHSVQQQKHAFKNIDELEKKGLKWSRNFSMWSTLASLKSGHKRLNSIICFPRKLGQNLI